MYLHRLFVAEAWTLLSTLALRSRVVLRHHAYVWIWESGSRRDKLICKRTQGDDLPRGSVDNKAECPPGHSDRGGRLGGHQRIEDTVDFSVINLTQGDSGQDQAQTRERG